MAVPSHEVSSADVRTHPSTFSCGQCGASLEFSGVRTQTCPYCTSPNFVERPPSANRPHPQFVLTFTGDGNVAKRALDRWLRTRSVFADGRLKHARVADLRGIYVPGYLYSAVAHTEYTAQIGEHYTETYTERDSDGKLVTKTRDVTRTEYRPLSGSHVGYVADIVVSASVGLSDAELAKIEPFEFLAMRRYAPALVSGWITEEWARRLDDCTRASRSKTVDEIGQRLRRFMPGDSHSDLVWRTRVDWESIDPILVPVWVLAVRYRPDKPALRVVINGQTGKVSGPTPYATWKIVLAMLVLVATAGLLVWLGNR